MLAGPRRTVSGPKRAAPVEPVHRGQLARLIRERPVFVNVARRRSEGTSKPRNFAEYVDFSGVFQGKDSGSPDGALDREPADISDP
jgi:hypothetical protein